MSYLHVLQPRQVAGALADGLLVGEDLPHILQPGAVLGQQVVTDLQPGGTDDIEVVPDHQIVYRLDGAGGAVFDGQDAVLAHAALHGFENMVKGLDICDLG